jgi:hypothetical protein
VAPPRRRTPPPRPPWRSWERSSADIAELDRNIDEAIAPFAPAVDRLDEITGVGRTAARRRTRNHVRQLEALGYKVTSQPAA